MLKYWSIKKYGTKLLPYLEKQYGKQHFYSSSQIRTIIYRKDFNPEYLPLGYILFLNIDELKSTFSKEFPFIEITEYKQSILSYLDKKSYQGYLQVLQNVAA
jgi:hypothetical protein